MSKIVHTKIWVTNSPILYIKVSYLKLVGGETIIAQTYSALQSSFVCYYNNVCIVNFFEFPHYTFAQQNIVNNCKIYQWPTSKS